MGICSLLALIVLVIPIPLWVTITYNFNYYEDLILDKFRADLPSEYDFIVVGSGSAGSVLANRLSKHNKVLLLEAGGDPIILHKVPLYAPSLLHLSQTDWLHATVPQKFGANGHKNNVIRWPRGKSLGGSSNLNYMIYVRGHPYDFDNWANLTHDSSWSYENVLPYFKKSYNYEGEFRDNVKHYGNPGTGPMYVTNSTFSRLDEEWHQGMKELGYDKVDFNSDMRTGFGKMEWFKKDGKRWDSYTGFIKPILNRQNLHISRYSHVTKIIFDKNKRAVGVNYVKNGRKRFVRARKEVIISAGTIDSAKLLMLSGIGPREHLKSKGISSLVDLPVGQNLQDHTLYLMPAFVIEKPLTYALERDFGFSEFYNFFMHGTGPLTVAGLCHHHAFISSSSVRKQNLDWPDLQLYFFSLSEYSAMASDFSAAYGIDETISQNLIKDVQGKNTFGVAIGNVRPKSIGSITLRDKSPFSFPRIDPRYLENPADVAAIIEGIKIVLNLVEKTKTFQNLKAYYPNTPISTCKEHTFRSDEYWECYIRTVTATIYHPVGTCKMGASNDPTAVVDPSLRVLHTKGLRVIDGSIMPVLVNGNTHAPIIMIGEKGSDMIRQYWSQQYLVSPRPPYYSTSYTKDAQKYCFYSQLV